MKYLELVLFISEIDYTLVLEFTKSPFKHRL